MIHITPYLSQKARPSVLALADHIDRRRNAFKPVGDPRSTWPTPPHPRFTELDKALRRIFQDPEGPRLFMAIEGVIGWHTDVDPDVEPTHGDFGLPVEPVKEVPAEPLTCRIVGEHDYGESAGEAVSVCERCGVVRERSGGKTRFRFPPT